MPTTILWFRDDLRLADHPALLTALEAAGGGRVVGVYVDDPATPTETAHRVWRCAALADLHARCEGHLVIRTGSPTDTIAELAADVGAASVHVTRDCTPAGQARDRAVRDALTVQGVEWVETGTSYAVGPGSVTKPGRTQTGGNGYAVFTPFRAAWLDHGWPRPAPDLAGAVPWLTGLDSDPVPTHSGWAELTAPPCVGEYTALDRLAEFCADHVGTYDVDRDHTALDGTSRLSTALAHGEIHPRTILAHLASYDSPGAAMFRSELAWREFYADVLWRHPHTATDYYRPQFKHMEYDTPGAQLRAWKFGRTGFPLVDAGMRQLRSTGWMHNRVRMVVASFLVKDLHLEWQHGARWFMRNLYDADLASNSHGWQWTAGCGTDAAPYFRIFNPITQGERFDSSGEYVRRYVPELRHLPGKTVHTPWKAPGGYAYGYPEPIVDHAAERRIALARYELIRR